MKYLGITLDECLSGNQIATGIIHKASARLKFLYRQGQFLNQKTRKTLASALIQCHFDYSCSSWYSGLSQEMKNKLQIMQNKVVRFVLDLGPRDHIGQKELDSVGLLKIEDRVKQLKLNHAFKVFHKLSPCYMSKQFVKIADVHHFNTRGSRFNFSIPRVKGQYGSNTFLYTAVKEWNALSSHVKDINNYADFKKNVKSFLASQARQREGSVP